MGSLCLCPHVQGQGQVLGLEGEVLGPGFGLEP